MHKSPFFGHSVEFVQHREYARGDDIRHLDWKVWSKTDRFYIKQFEAETNLRATLVVDVSESMHYGRGAAEQVRVRLHRRRLPRATCSLRQQDSVGPDHASTRTSARCVPPRSARSHIDAIVKAHARQQAAARRPTSRRSCAASPRAIAGRGMIVLISDLLADREPLFQGLEMLRHRRHDMLVFHVLDDDELTFPFAGTTRFEGMEELPRPAVRPAGAARRLPGGAGGVPGRGPPRLHPAGHRLHAGPARATTWTRCCRSSCTAAWPIAVGGEGDGGVGSSLRVPIVDSSQRSA